MEHFQIPVPAPVLSAVNIATATATSAIPYLLTLPGGRKKACPDPPIPGIHPGGRGGAAAEVGLVLHETSAPLVVPVFGRLAGSSVLWPSHAPSLAGRDISTPRMSCRHREWGGGRRGGGGLLKFAAAAGVGRSGEECGRGGGAQVPSCGCYIIFYSFDILSLSLSISIPVLY